MNFTDKELSVIESALTLYIQNGHMRGENSEVSLKNRQLANEVVLKIESIKSQPASLNVTFCRNFVTLDSF